MTTIDCAEFEAGLADLLERRDGGGEELRETLRRHAAGCDGCRGAMDLLELAAAPQASRDPIPDPGQPYWTDFDRRLHERLRSESLRFAPRGRGGWRIAAAVAAIAALAAVVAALHPWGAPAHPVIASARPAPIPAPELAAAPEQAPIPAPVPVRAPEAGAPGPGEGAEGRTGIRSATPVPPPTPSAEADLEDDAAEAFTMGEGSDPFAESGDPELFPSVDDLSAEQQERFGEWLSREEARVKRGAA